MEKPPAQARIKVKRSGNQYWATVCQHCTDSMCVRACMTGAMQYSTLGEVIHNIEKCVGCWMCIMVCPLGAIASRSEAKKASKCDLVRMKILPLV